MVNAGFLEHRQRHAIGLASVSLDFLCKSIIGGKSVIELFTSRADIGQKQATERLAAQELLGESATNPVGLKIEAHGSTYLFFFSTQKDSGFS